jgi:hypothetical protein
MKKIPLSQGKFALVDDADFEALNQYKWCTNKIKNTFYALRNTRQAGVKKTIMMHREIMQTPKGMDTDHRDGDGLNNQRSNLRICTHSENLRNVKKDKDNTSGFKGVSWHSGAKKWKASIMTDGKETYLGIFTLKVDAYKAYCEACVKYHGEFARLK